jgi:hypothetical protein
MPKMSVEDRDFLGGNSKADAIANAIQESRHVIFVISEFLQENNWRAFEIERSKFEKYTNDLQKIIVIVKDVSVRSIAIELDKILKDITIIEAQNVSLHLKLTMIAIGVVKTKNAIKQPIPKRSQRTLLQLLKCS